MHQPDLVAQSLDPPKNKLYVTSMLQLDYTTIVRTYGSTVEGGDSSTVAVCFRT